MAANIIAHRGDCQYFIENTYESVQAAINGGIKHIEIDVQLTKDGIPILYHDRTLERLCGEVGAVRNRSFEHMKSRDFTDSAFQNKSQAYGGNQETIAAFRVENEIIEKITALSEIVKLIEFHPEITLFVEIKQVNFLSFSYREVSEVIADSVKSIQEQVVLMSFSYRFLRTIQQQTSPLSGGISIAYVLPSWQQYNMKMLEKLTPNCVFASVEIIPETFEFNQSASTWALYEIDSLKMAESFISRGATYLETFYSVALLEQLNENS